MKKSSQVPATLIIAIAASLTTSGCSGSNQCQDASGRILPNSACQGGTIVGGAHWVHVGGFGGGSGGIFGG